MRAHERYWALWLTGRLLVSVILIVTSMVVAIKSHGYWGHGGILVPTSAVIVMVASAITGICTLDALAKHAQQTER